MSTTQQPDVMVTVTPGNAPPEESTTSPAIDPRDSWAATGRGPNTKLHASTASVNLINRVISPPVLK